MNKVILLLHKYLKESHQISEYDVETIIYYGNKEGKDIDLLVILNTDLIEFDNFEKNNLDINIIGVTTFKKMFKHKDHLVTEPILTGEIIKEWNIFNIEKLKKRIKLVNINKNDIFYLKQQASIFLHWALVFQYNKKEDMVKRNLRFVISFLSFANYYENNKKVITYKELKTKIDEEILLLLNKKNNINIEEQVLQIKNYFS